MGILAERGDRAHSCGHARACAAAAARETITRHGSGPRRTQHNRPVQQHINQRLNNINVHRYYLVLGSFANGRAQPEPGHRRETLITLSNYKETSQRSAPATCRSATAAARACRSGRRSARWAAAARARYHSPEPRVASKGAA